MRGLTAVFAVVLGSIQLGAAERQPMSQVGKPNFVFLLMDDCEIAAFRGCCFDATEGLRPTAQGVGAMSVPTRRW